MKLIPFCFSVLLLLFACQQSDAVHGDILFWYAADEIDLATFAIMLNEFEVDRPNVTVVAVAIPADELAERFATAAAQGLGPDLILSSAEHIHAWAADDLIRTVELDEFAQLTPLAQQATYYQKQSYAVPLALNPLVLYANTDKVETPALTLDQWLQQAQDGRRILLHNRFHSLFWGVPAFGGTLMDEDGQITLTPESMIEWLNWLQMAQAEGDLIISRDEQLLRNRFLAGDATYILADRHFWPQATAVLTDTVTMTTLPAGSAASGSLVEVEALMINRHASPAQVGIAHDLIRYLTNVEQSATWLRETGRIPANVQARVDRRLYPELSIIAEEAAFGVPYTNDIDLATLHELGNPLFASVLSGSAEPEAAVCEFGQQLQAAYPTQFDQTRWEPLCSFGGTQ